MNDTNRPAPLKAELTGEEAGTPAPEASAQEKPDLLDYLESLPDVEDPFDPSEPAPEPETKDDLHMLADYIRARSAAGLLTPKAALLEDNEDMETLLARLAEDESCADIRTEQGQKDLYYYATPIMAVNYAHMAMLAEEKDHCRAIADMVRHQCKIGPACTKVYFFTAPPYSLTKTQIDVALNMMRKREAYADIQETQAFNGVRFLYSAQHISAKYAKALADFSEEGEENM